MTTPYVTPLLIDVPGSLPTLASTAVNAVALVANDDGAGHGASYRWTGSAWVRNDPIGSPNLQIVPNMPALEALPTTLLSDVCLCIVQSPRGLYALNKTGTPAASGDMEIPPATPSGRWDLVVTL